MAARPCVCGARARRREERRDYGKKEHGSGEGEGERAAIVSGGCIRRANRGRGRPAIAVVVTGCWPRAGFLNVQAWAGGWLARPPFCSSIPHPPTPTDFIRGLCVCVGKGRIGLGWLYNPPHNTRGHVVVCEPTGLIVIWAGGPPARAKILLSRSVGFWASTRPQIGAKQANATTQLAS